MKSSIKVQKKNKRRKSFKKGGAEADGSSGIGTIAAENRTMKSGI